MRSRGTPGRPSPLKLPSRGTAPGRGVQGRVGSCHPETSGNPSSAHTARFREANQSKARGGLGRAPAGVCLAAGALPALSTCAPAGAAVSPWAGDLASEPPCLHAAGFLSAEPNLPGNSSFDRRVAHTLPGAGEARAALRTRARALQKCIKSCSENRPAGRGPTPLHAQGVGDDGAARQSPFSGWFSGNWTGHASGRR